MKIGRSMSASTNAFSTSMPVRFQLWVAARDRIVVSEFWRWEPVIARWS